jgi:signal transduction histidine kinase
LVASYMIAALLWWSVLLLRKNELIWQTRQEYLQESYNNIFGTSAYQIKDVPEYKIYEKSYNSQKKMIIGEGLVFGFLLLLGLYILHKAYKKQVESTENQKNFLLSITHELKSPLTSIRLGLQTIHKRHETKPELVRNISESSLLEADRLESLINKLLLAAQLNQAYQYYFQETSLTQCVHRAIEIVKNNQKSLEIVTQLQETESLSMIDKEAMEIAILNLLENSIKYGEGKPIEIESKVENNYVSLKVTDQGVGIPDYEKQKIFDQFYRVGSEEVRKSKGTGIGLYLVKKIVEAHSGKIMVTDNQPKGSIFTIKIPISQSLI